MYPTLLQLALPLLLSTTLVSAFNVSKTIKGAINNGDIIPGRWIVEMDSTAHLQSAGLKRSASPHDALYSQLAERGISYNVVQTYSSPLFIGASVSLDSASSISTIASLSGVIGIHPVHRVALPAVAALSKADASFKPTLRNATTASAVTKSTSTGPSTTTTTTCTTARNKKVTCTTKTVTASATAKPTSSAYPTTGFSILPQVQADKVQATGNKGKGVQIAIIDSGIDYLRPELGGGFGAGFKVAGGYDYVGDNFDGSNTPVPDSDPYDDCYGHGTIVAGIVGSNDNIYNTTGVAPEATLYAYRVFSCTGSGTDDIILQAMQQAYNDGADVINLSLDEVSGWTESALSVLASRLNAAGVVVVSAAGNGGQNGAFYSSAPAAAIGALAVGSSDSAFMPANNVTTSTGYGPITYYNFESFPFGTFQLYDLNNGCNADVPANPPDLSNYVIIATRGACTLVEKAQNAANLGARGIFVVNSAAAISYLHLDYIPFAMISPADGAYLRSQIATIKLIFTFNPYPIPNTATSGSVSYFSSRGPTYDMYMVPQLVAPGSNLIGMLPTAIGSWVLTQGTSFSCAYATGAAALYINAKGKNVTPQTILEAFQFSALPVPVSSSDGSLESTASQGAGRLQIYDGLNSNVIVSPTELLLNDTANSAYTQTFTIKNTGNWLAWYNIKHVPAGTALAYQTGVNQSNDEPVPQISNAAKVRFSWSNILLFPGWSWTIIAEFTPPSGVDPKTFPIYSGFIEVNGGNNVVNIPYMGVAASLKTMPVLDPTSYYLGINTPTILQQAYDDSGSLSMDSSNIQVGPKTYTFQGADYPTVLYRLVGGSPLILIDLISATANLGFTPTYTSTKRDLEARRLSSAPSTTNFVGDLILDYLQLLKGGKGNTNPANTFQKVPIRGNIYYSSYNSRNTDNADGQGNDYLTLGLSTPAFANGTTIPNGTYKFLLRALKITGDITNESDYEAWTSQTFTVAQ